VFGAAAVAAFAAGRAASSQYSPTFGAIYEQTTLPAAQERMPFTIAQPGRVPAGAHVELIYRSVARTGADIVLAERRATDPDAMTKAGHGPVQQIVVAGQPAAYVIGLPSQQRRDATLRVDSAAQALVIDRARRFG
jgi:hypothetical protein